jgi:hypothetical protein
VHQRVTTDPFRILSLYERGLLTLTAIANDLVEATVSPPTAELVARLPAEVGDLIRELVRMPFYNERFLKTDPLGGEEQRAEQERWLARVALWREHFGITD